MQVIPEPSNVTNYQCPDCAFAFDVAPSDERPLVERFDGQSGRSVYRVVTVGGDEVHRCISPFLMLS